MEITTHENDGSKTAQKIKKSGYSRKFKWLFIIQLLICLALVSSGYLYALSIRISPYNEIAKGLILLIPTLSLLLFGLIYGFQWAFLRSDKFKDQRKVAKLLTLTALGTFINAVTFLDVVYFSEL